MPDWIKNNKLSLVFLLILTLLTYSNSLNNSFLSDDIPGIVQDPKIGNLWFAISSHPFNFIRPILYWGAFQVGGLNPIIFRSINILFHVGSVFLIYMLFAKLFSKRLGIFVASIFAVHPAISEAVVWISGGMYSEYTFFFLLSFFCYILSQNSKKLYFLSILFFFLSHSQMSAPLFLIFPLYELSFANFKKNWQRSIPFALISILFLILILTGLPGRADTLQTVNYQEKGIDNPFVIIPIAITSYLELILFPKALTLYHSELAFGTINFAIRSLVTILFFIGILMSFKKNKFIFFWGSFFLITLSPTLTPFRLNWIVAERYLYLPIIGILALLGSGLNKMTNFKKYKQAVYIIFAIIVVLLSVRTIIRNIDWKNQDNLWLAAFITSPSSPNNHNNLGDMYGRHGDKLLAIKEFKTAIALKPNYGDAYHNLANTYHEIGDDQKALENYENAIKYNPNLWQSYQNIASIHFEKARQSSSSAQETQKEYNLTIEYLQKALQINQNNINIVTNLGIVYLSSGDKAKAKEIFNLILSADPQNQVARAGLEQANK